MAIPDEPENLQFARREIVIAQMLGKACRHLWRNMPPSLVDGADHGYQFILWRALQEVGRSAGAQRPVNLTVAIRGREHDNARLRKLLANGYHGIGAVAALQPNVHESDVWAMSAEARDRLPGGRRLRNEKHVLLRGDDRTESLAENRMIFDAQNANGFTGDNGHMPPFPIVRAMLPARAMLSLRAPPSRLN